MCKPLLKLKFLTFCILWLTNQLHFAVQKKHVVYDSLSMQCLFISKIPYGFCTGPTGSRLDRTPLERIIFEVDSELLSHVLNLFIEMDGFLAYYNVRFLSMTHKPRYYTMRLCRSSITFGLGVYDKKSLCGIY